MNDLINGRTPEEIVEANRHCSRCFCDECAYFSAIECQTDLRRDCADLIKHLEAKRPKWISVKDRLPEAHGIYLVHVVHRYCKVDSYSRVSIEYFSKDRDWDSLVDLYEVTHWMPLPSGPEEEANAD